MINRRAFLFGLLAAALFAFGLLAIGVPLYPVRSDTSIVAAALAPSNQSATTTPKVIPEIPSEVPQSQWAERDKLVAMLKPKDPNSLFTVVDTIESDPALALNCHEIAHDIGHQAYIYWGFSGALNFTDAARLNHASVQDICAGGYIHGVLEEAALYQPDFAKNPGAMCATVSAADKASCFHGIGHALMFTYARNVQSSLAGCRLVGDVNEASRCFEGVWMELFWGNEINNDPASLGWDESKPLAPCIATENDAKPACFLYSSFGYLRANPKNYAGAVQLCTQSNLDDSDTGYCLKGVGITMISHFKAKNLEQSESFAAGLSDNQKTAFYKGVFGYAELSGISNADLHAECSLMKTDTAICNGVVSGQVQ